MEWGDFGGDAGGIASQWACGSSKATQAPAQAAVPAKAQQTAEPRKTSTPYTGDLSIFEREDRDDKLQVQRVMDILGVVRGARVADIGAGSGWFTVRAAKRVGEQGVVYAVDINPEAIAYINRRAERGKIHNVHTVLGSADDPKLPADGVDCVLMLKTYHEVAHPVVLLENLRKSLRAGRSGGSDRSQWQWGRPWTCARRGGGGSGEGGVSARSRNTIL